MKTENMNLFKECNIIAQDEPRSRIRSFPGRLGGQMHHRYMLGVGHRAGAPKARRTQSSRPEGPPARSWGPEKFSAKLEVKS